MLNNASSVVVNVLVNSSTAAAGVQGFNVMMLQIKNTAVSTAQQSQAAFSTIFGANFFADLAANMLRNIVAGFRSLVSEAIDAATKMESALVGVGSTAKNLGLSQSDVQDTVRGLDLVQKGLLNVGDAATATKNLLATGFSLPQAVELIKRFGDTAAFGRQSALSFGYAISSATEGIKNQNSILVDNAGVTKNLSVIMAERGFVIQDLSDKVKGAAAREALYQGLLKETAVQMGDSNKLLETTQGAMLRLDAAWQRFLVNLGETFTKSNLAKGAISGLVAVLDYAGNNQGKILLLVTAIGLLTAAVYLSSTAFGTMTAAQIANSIASAGVVTAIGNVITAMVGLQTATALTAGEIIVATGGLAAIAIVIGVVVAAVYSYSSATSEATKLTQQSISTMVSQRDNYEVQLKSLQGLADANLTQIERNRAVEIAYRGVNVESQARSVLAISEAEKIRILTDEYVRLRDAQNDKLQTSSRITAGNLLGEITKFQTASAGQTTQAEIIRRAQGSILDPNQIETAGLSQSFKSRAEQDFTKLGKDMDVSREAAANLNAQLQALAKAQNTTVDELIRQKFAFEGNASAADAAIASYYSFIGAQNAASKATAQLNDLLFEQGTALSQASDAAARSAAIKDLTETFAEAFKSNPNLGQKSFKDFIETVPELKQKVEDQKGYNAALKQLNDYLDLTPAKTKKTKTEFESLTDGVRKLSGEVNSYRNLSAGEFKLRFQKEELERTKRDFEQIIDLRRELGLPLNLSLPNSAEAARGEVEHLNTVKRLRDDVLKNYRETAEAEEKLTVLRLSSGAAIVSAETRYQTQYLENLRERKNAEAELTANLAAEMKKRADFSVNFVQREQTAQAGALLEVLQEKTNQDSERLKMVARLQVLSGEVFADNPLVKAAAALTNTNPEQSPVVGRLDKSNLLLAEILSAVRLSGTSGAGSAVANVTARNEKGGAIIKAAGLLGVSPVDLAAIIGYESAGTFSTGKWGGKGGNYQGLIQFGAEERQKYGVSGNQTFEQQLFNSVIPYLRDRFKSVGRSTQGATMMDLYKTINGGNPSVSSNASDSVDKNGRRVTIADHVQRIAAQQVPAVMKMFFTEATAQVTATVQPAAVNRPKPAKNRIGGNWVASGSAGNLGDAGAPEIGADDFSRDFFKLGVGSSFLSKESLGNLQTYFEAIKAYKDLGKSDGERNQNLKLQAIGQDRINQIINVRFKQMADMAVIESRINNIISGDSVTKREILNEAEIARRKNYESSLRTLVATNDYLGKLRTGNGKVIGELITQADAERATATAKAYEDIAKSKSFLEKFAAGDKSVLEYLQKSREAADVNDRVNLTVDVDRLRAESQSGRNPALISLETDKERLTVLNSVGRATTELTRLETLRGEASYVASKRSADSISEETALKRKLFELEDERANLGTNSGLRVTVAAEDERNQIDRERQKAQEDAARARVRLNNAEVLDIQTANARVLQHIASVKSMTEVYGDAKIAIVDKVWNGIDTVTAKIFSRIPVIGSILKDIVSSMLKLVANSFLRKLLGLESSGATGESASTSSGNRTAGVTDVFRQIFTGGGGSAGGAGGFGSASPSGTTPPFAGFSNPFSAGSSGGSFSSTARALGGTRQFLSFLTQAAGDSGARPILGNAGDGGAVGQGAAAAQSSGLFGKFSNWLGLKQGSGATGAIAGALPFLGLGLGSQVGGGSGFGGILGSVGGLGGGILGSALLTGSTSTLFGGAFAGGIPALGITSSALAATVVLAPIAGALLAASYFIGRSAKRRKEETQSNQIRVDAKTQLQKILENLRQSSNPSDIENALSQANQIRADYLNQVNQLTDKKTKTNAVAFVRELDAIIDQIKSEGAAVRGRSRKQNFADAYDNALVPTFDGGGMFNYVSSNPSMWRRTAADTAFAYNPNTEAVLTRRDIYAMGGYGALNRAGVRGAGYEPSTVSQAASFKPASSGGGSGSSDQAVYNIIVFGDAEAKKMTEKLSGRGLINVIKPILQSDQDEGFVDLIGNKLSGK